MDIGDDFHPGMDRSEMMEALRDKQDEIRDELARIAEVWQGDKFDDRLARALIAAQSMLVEPLAILPEEGEDISNLLMMLYVKTYIGNMKAIVALRDLNHLKGE